jgi:hypothetical protein
VFVILAVALVALAGVVFVRALQRPGHPSADRPESSDPPAATAIAVGAPDSARSRSASPPASSRSVPESVRRPVGPSVHTPEGLWWGVDSTVPISAASIANVRRWYRGAPRPQFWGRYLSGSFGVSRAELAYARKQKIFVYLIVTDHNCSGCGGGDACGHDRTAAQARSDALDAIRGAHRLRLPLHTALFKDIEQVSSCRGEPTSRYLLSWYHTMRDTGFQTGFYGNVHKQSYDFPVAYCRALARDATMGTNVVLDMNENEPRIGAPRGSTGPHNAPRFNPNSPSCAPKFATKIWQYGESLTTANLTDIDQARPDTPGLLAPDGSVTG